MRIEAAAPTKTIVVEAHHAAAGAEPGAVLGGAAADEVDVGRCESALILPAARRLANRLAKERRHHAAAEAQRRLGDDDRHRQEALAVEQPLRQIEVAVVGIFQVLEPLGSVRRRHRQQHRHQPRGHESGASRPATGRWRCAGAGVIRDRGMRVGFSLCGQRPPLDEGPIPTPLWFAYRRRCRGAAFRHAPSQPTMTRRGRSLLLLPGALVAACAAGGMYDQPYALFEAHQRSQIQDWSRRS